MARRGAVRWKPWAAAWCSRRSSVSFQALGRARAYGDTDGFVKIVAGQPHGEILGMHVIGPGASDIISEGVLAIRLEATVDDLRETVHAHPTFAEATAEAAWQAINAPIHLPLPRNGR